MKRLMALALSLMLGAFAVQAQQSQTTAITQTTKKKAVQKGGSAVADQLEELRQELDAQRQQIQRLSDQVQSGNQEIQQLQQKLDESQTVTTKAQSKADNANAQATEQQQAFTTLNKDVADLKANSTSAALSLQETQKTIQSVESP
jgi:uncharacterized coiled-coil DUF342 family protein